MFKCRWYGVARVSTSCEVDLSVGVQVETSLAVQKVRDKCSMLPSMDKKLDTILGLAQDNADKLDQVRPHIPTHTYPHPRTRTHTHTGQVG